jgi:pseudouridine-5'-phosphate glycosidase
MSPHLKYSDEVATALAKDAPVVALESTIITHGMPYPQNLETALDVEAEIRNAGATPATIAVIDGSICVGMERAALEQLAQTEDVMKLSRADLAFAVGNGKTGATTVAATMIAAHLAGIEVFATGGIGGVHRGAQQSFDISADLTELATTPVAVICAGAKAILDIPKTMEVLETNGVAVITYGQDNVPAFWSRDADIPSPLRADDTDTLAKAFRTRRDLNVAGGMLIANPIPAENEISRETLAPLIAQAQDEADAQGIAAKDVTPFLLSRLFDLTNGASLTANIALVKNNARLAANLAQSLVKLRS